MKTKLLAAFAAASVLALTGCSGGDEVGDVSLGMFTLKDIKIRPTAPSPAARRAKSRPR